MNRWQALSTLLLYPDGELLDALDEVEDAVGRDRRLGRVVSHVRDTPLAELQRAYVSTFDFDRRASLHLTYHTHGDRRQRGLELVRLKRRYAEAGLVLEEDLPDYLPAVLECAALRPEVGEAVLAEQRPAIELVRSRLHTAASPYAAVLDAVVDALPRLTRRQRAAAERIAREGPPAELVGLDTFPRTTA